MQQNKNTISAFLRDKVPEIFKKEHDNICTIYLYYCGDYWLALEHSAYLLYVYFHFTGKLSALELIDGSHFVMIEESDSIIRHLQEANGNKEMTNKYVKIKTTHLVLKADFEEWKRKSILIFST